MDMLNKNLHKAILGTQKSDGELMLESVSVEKSGNEINSSKLIGINIASEVNKVIPGFIAAGSAYRAKDIINSTDVYKIVLKDGFSQDSVKRFLTNKDQKMITTYLDVNGKFNQAGLEKVMGEMSDIIDLMDTIKSFDLTYDDTKDNNSISLSEVREDIAQPSFPTDKLLSNAENSGSCYVVPKVVE